MVGEGSTVLLTTQYMDEAEQLADDLTVIDKGRVIADGSVEALKRQVGGQTLTVRPAVAAQLAEMVRCLAAYGATSVDDSLMLPVGDEEQLTAVIAELARGGFAVAGIETRMPSLEEVFLTITGTGTGTRTGTEAETGERQDVPAQKQMEGVR